jgi:hypothetical protein
MSVEDLLEARAPSAMARADAALIAEGLPPSEILLAKEAMAALGALAYPTASTAPPLRVRDRILASARRGGAYGIFADRIARLFALSTEEASALMAKIEAPDAWLPFLVPGVEMIPVTTGPALSGAIATLVRFQPGVTFPAHVHRGVETMVVLDGGFQETGPLHDEVWRGDELYRADGSEHAFVALEGVPCIAAALVIGYADFK